jgi:hypothetical protein
MIHLILNIDISNTNIIRAELAFVNTLGRSISPSHESIRAGRRLADGSDASADQGAGKAIAGMSKDGR